MVAYVTTLRMFGAFRKYLNKHIVTLKADQNQLSWFAKKKMQIEEDQENKISKLYFIKRKKNMEYRMNFQRIWL